MIGPQYGPMVGGARGLVHPTNPYEGSIPRCPCSVWRTPFKKYTKGCNEHRGINKMINEEECVTDEKYNDKHK